MSDEIKLAWHSNVKCPKCGRWMRIRSSSISERYYRAEVLCGYCGVHEWLKVPIEQYTPRPEKEIVLAEVVEGTKKESVGRNIYGRRGRARSARRVKKENK